MSIFNNLKGLNMLKCEDVKNYKLEDLKNQKILVLEHGFVKLLDWMGGDESIVAAARQSYGEGTKRVREDRHLIRYLMRGVNGRKHTSPIEQAELQIQVKCPIDVWRQWIRNRTANVNEYSTRYSEALEDVHIPKFDEWRLQSTSNKQGSGDYIESELGIEFEKSEREFVELAQKHYKNKLEKGISREQARSSLPLGNYTMATWKIDLHNLLHHFIFLRVDEHAQFEIRQYANVISEIVKIWCPHVWEAFDDYTLESVNFSRMEMLIIRELTKSLDISASNLMKMLENSDSKGKHKEMSKREWDEFYKKISPKV